MTPRSMPQKNINDKTSYLENRLEKDGSVLMQGRNVQVLFYFFL